MKQRKVVDITVENFGLCVCVCRLETQPNAIRGWIEDFVVNTDFCTMHRA